MTGGRRSARRWGRRGGETAWNPARGHADIYISDFKSRWKLRGRQLSDRVYRRPEFDPKDRSKQTGSYGRNVVGR